MFRILCLLQEWLACNSFQCIFQLWMSGMYWEQDGNFFIFLCPLTESASNSYCFNVWKNLPLKHPGLGVFFLGKVSNCRFKSFHRHSYLRFLFLLESVPVFCIVHRIISFHLRCLIYWQKLFLRFFLFNVCSVWLHGLFILEKGNMCFFLGNGWSASYFTYFTLLKIISFFLLLLGLIYFS